MQSSMAQRMQSVARSGASAQGAVRPFTASKLPVRVAVQQRPQLAAVVARAAAAEDVATTEQAAAIVELEPIVLGDEEQEQRGAVERVALDDDDRLALRVAEDVMPAFSLEAVLEGELDEALSGRAAAAVEVELEEARGELPATLAAAAEVLAASVSEVVELPAVEDYQGPAGFRKYDEQEDASIPDENYESIQRVKLTRTELSNLVPKDWDTVNVDWFSNKKEENIPLPDYKLTFLWQNTNISVAVDQVYSRGQTSPLTEYFVWPRKDAWEDLKTALETRPFVSER